MSGNDVYVSLRSGSDELTMHGQPDLIGRVLKGLGMDTTTIEIVSGGQVEENIKPPVMPPIKVEDKKPLDLVAFFRKLAPESQSDQVLVITYFYQKYTGAESLSLAQYDEAYTQLRRVPVEPPGSVKNAVRNTVDRTKYLRNADRGQYMLTLAGEEYVERLISGDQGGL